MTKNIIFANRIFIKVKRGIFLLLACFLINHLPAQDVYQKFYYQDGTLSSEGYMNNGKPNGYWKSYYPNGVLRSEGNRKDFLLDSLWKFYNTEGELASEITYKEGLKHGINRVYEAGYIQEYHYYLDTIVGQSRQYDYFGHLVGIIPYENGRAQGWGRFYDTLGRLVRIFQYEKGNIIRRENVNRIDANGMRQGTWKTFNDSGYLVLEGYYQNNKKNGYFKYYDSIGRFQYIEKYENDILIEDAVETKKLDRKVDYHANGKIKTVAHYFKGVPEGIRREYDENGNVVKSYVFHNGSKMSEGIVDDNGKKQGLWKEFYESGLLRAKGHYQNSLPVGAWNYYYEDGSVEITGAYSKKGKKDGPWWWYYANGEVLSYEEYDQGDLNGDFYSLSITGDTLVRGRFESGYEVGKWYWMNDSTRIEGKYEDGKRTGTWKTFYPNGKLKIEEHYADDMLNGKVIYYWENGSRMAEYIYINDLLDGNAYRYDENGTPTSITTYKMGVEVKYNGVKVEPTIDITFE